MTTIHRITSFVPALALLGALCSPGVAHGEAGVSGGRRAASRRAASGRAHAASRRMRSERVPSSNWAGYAIHRSGVSFRSAAASWQISSATCVAGQPSYSATWVGIGGYSLRSRALEQIGTETDCGARGRIRTYAWYELVPAASRHIRLRVRSGDQVRASVTVVGHKVTLSLRDLTTRRAFERTLRDAAVDSSSAEWIEEAPSACTPSGNCRILPLADFGQVRFRQASASVGGRRGGIASPNWSHTAIYLTAGGSPFVSQSVAPLAVPSGLDAAGRGFAISYQLPPASDRAVLMPATDERRPRPALSEPPRASRPRAAVSARHTA